MAHIIGNRRLISLVIATVFFVTSVLTLSGEVSAIESQDYSQGIKSCEHVQSKLSQKTEEFTKKRQDHLDKYSKIKDLFSSVTNTLDSAGYDVALLEELQPGYDRRVNNFSEVSQRFLNEMSDASGSACRDKQSFSQELDEARTSLKDVQNSVADIRDYMQRVMVTSIKNVVEAETN